MKSGTESKTKFRQLKRRLHLRYWQAVGVLETLWRVTRADAPAGDIGKLDNEEIAAAMEWEGDPDELINALVETHWIDRDDDFRLVIHNWSKHVPNHMKGAFVKHDKMFADQIISARRANGHVARDDAKQLAKHTARDGPIAPCLGTMLEHHATQPNLTKPNLTKPNHPQTPTENSRLAAGGWDFWNKEWEGKARNRLKATGYKRIKELIEECRTERISPQQVIEACDEFDANKPKFTSPGAIAERLRTGIWPVEGVVSVQEANGRSQAANDEKTKQAIEAVRRKLIKEIDDTARDWTDRQILDAARKQGWI